LRLRPATARSMRQPSSCRVGAQLENFLGSRLWARTGKLARIERRWHEKNLEGAVERWRCGTEAMVVADSKQQQTMAAGCVLFPGRRREGGGREEVG
jgi:hypothetical protein